ncbi:uncharacterized protein AAGF69_016154 [Amazona ochrocephala]
MDKELLSKIRRKQEAYKRWKQGMEPAAPTLAGAAEEEQHHAPHAAAAQEEEQVPAPASHGFDEQEAVAEAQRKAFELPSPTASELAQELASRLAREILREALAVIQEADEQPLEQEDVAQNHVDATMAPIRPAAVQDIETSVAAEPVAEACVNEQQTPVQAQTEAPAPQWVTVVDTAVQVVDRQQVRRAPKKHQGEASAAVASPALHKDEQAGSPASVQDTKDKPGTSPSQVAPRLGRQQHVHDFGHALASPLRASTESSRWKPPGKALFGGWQQELTRCLPNPASTALLSPQASPPSRTQEQSKSDDHPASGGR